MNVNPIRRRRIAPNILFPIINPERALNQWLWSRQTQQLVNALLFNDAVIKGQYPTMSSSTDETALATSPGDQWGFGWCWYSIHRNFPTKESLYAVIHERRNQILKIKEKWRSFIENSKHIDPLFENLLHLSIEETTAGSYRIQPDHLHLSEEGISGAYFLSDADGHNQFVVKPVDEDIGCLNNGKGFSTPYTYSTVRDNIPLYFSAMRETLAYEMACAIGVDNVAPHTVLAILDCAAFHDQIDDVALEEHGQYESLLGSGRIQEKLCSVQEFIPDSKTLFEGLQELQQLGMSDEEIANRIDQRDFEDANILLWATYDTDGHMGNFLVYPKSIDAVGHEILGIKKIDNGLAFPEKNEELRNNLRYLPNASRKLSDEGRAKIAAMSIDNLIDKLNQFGLNGSSDALRERITVLKELAQRDDLSLEDIDRRMSGIGQKNSSDYSYYSYDYSLESTSRN